MRFSIWPSPMRAWSDVLDITRHADRTGWEGVYFADHFMPNDMEGDRPLDGPTLECWSVLAGLASATEHLRLGSLVCGNTYRHPAVLANIAAATDHVSNGRVVLGLGAGWQVNEHKAYGIDLFDTRTRLDRFEEACAIVRSLLDNERTTFQGEHYAVTDAPCQPRPVQARLPLLVGGGGEKRTLRIAAAYADEWNVWGTAELCRQKASVLERHCEAIGRDPSTIGHSTQALVFLSEDEQWLAGKRTQDTGRPVIVGTPDEVVDIVAATATRASTSSSFPTGRWVRPLARRTRTTSSSNAWRLHCDDRFVRVSAQPAAIRHTVPQHRETKETELP